MKILSVAAARLPSAAVLSGSRVLIRPPRAGDARAFLAAVRRSRPLHRGWVSPPATQRTFREYVARSTSDWYRGFLVVQKETGILAGVINVSSILRGNFQSAFLGYYAFAGCSGQGFMAEGLRLVLRHAFGKLKLHRLEANIQPGNASSIALVRTCGFIKEGFSRRYLKVAGGWRDHERWAILAEDFRARGK